MTSLEDILVKLRQELELEDKAVINPISYCPYAFASFRTVRYTFQSWWIDVVELRPGYYYVFATIDRPLLETENDIQVNDGLKDCYCLDHPVPSKAVVYLQYHKKKELLDIIDGSELEPPSECFLSINPFQNVRDKEITFREMVIEIEQEDVENIFSSDEERQ